MNNFDNFNENFIEKTFVRVSHLIDKETLTKESICLYNLTIQISNTLKNYNVNCDYKELVAYDNPFSIVSFINTPLFMISISFSTDDNNDIEYHVEIKNIKYDIIRKYTSKSLNLIQIYLVGFLSAYTSINEIVKTAN